MTFQDTYSQLWKGKALKYLPLKIKFFFSRKSNIDFDTDQPHICIQCKASRIDSSSSLRSRCLSNLPSQYKQYPPVNKPLRAGHLAFRLCDCHLAQQGAAHWNTHNTVFSLKKNRLNVLELKVSLWKHNTVHGIPNENDQARKGPCFFQRLIALKCRVKKFKKISNPPLGSYLVNEPKFCLINWAFLYDFVILKKVSKKQGSFNPWPSHICWSSLHPPPSAKHVSCLGHSVQLPTVWKSVFSKIGRLFAEPYLCNETSSETPFLSRFFIFYDVLNLNQDFRANLRCKSCVQLPILWKTRFSQTLRCHIFATKHPTDEIKYSLKLSFLSRFFIFYYFFNLN